MDRLFVPTLGATDWRRLLADPRKQWRQGRSAYELAVAWEAVRTSARGIPPAIARVLDGSLEFPGAKLVLALPELQVNLPGGGHASQTDLWALLDTNGEFVSVALEAKAGEPLGETVGQWLAKGKPGNGRQTRLAALRGRLALADMALEAVRYQLLHRAASALIMAERFRATKALLLIVSFDEEKDRASLEDFKRFGALFGVGLAANAIVELPRPGAVRLFAGWVGAQPASCTELGAAL